MKRLITLCILLVSTISTSHAATNTLEAIQEQGILKHLGVPYANFITGAGDGLSVEVMQRFAEHLGVKYQYVETSWSNAISDLTGKKVKAVGDNVEILGEAPIRGDLIANGFTIIPWREKIVTYSTPTFPTQVWLIARGDAGMQPILPSGDIEQDITAVKKLLAQRSVLGKENTCLDPALYNLEAVGATTSLFDGNLNDLAPAVISRAAETAILDVPDALVALEKWPGQMLVIGPISPEQVMAIAFRKESNELRKEFNRFYKQLKKEGIYVQLVKKYYPAVFDYYPEFFLQ